MGDTQANLLRIVLVKDKEGWIVSEEFATPLYFRLSRSNFNTETIFITDDNGNEVPFEDATVQVTLHFDRPVTCSYRFCYSHQPTTPCLWSGYRRQESDSHQQFPSLHDQANVHQTEQHLGDRTERYIRP